MTGKEEWIIEIGDTLLAPKKEDDFLIKENENNVFIFFKKINITKFFPIAYIH